MNYEPTITFWPSLTETKRGSAWTAPSWESVFDRLSHAVPYAGDHEHPGWSAARFEPCERALENVKLVYALCLDFDHGETIRGVRQRLAGFFGVLHTTRKHTPEAPRFRVVLPFSRPVTPAEYEALWVRFANWAGRVDQSPKDPSRFWYLPGVKPDGAFEAHRLNGEPIDVDEWLDRPDPTPAPAIPPPSREDAPRTRDTARVEERAVKYIARMEPAISGQGGHLATWRVACALARGFGLSEERTFRILWHDYNPRCEPRWSEKELRHKAKQAQKANLPFGYLLNEPPPDRAPTRWEAPPEPELPPDDELEPMREPGDDSEEIQAEQARKRPAVERFPVSTLRQMMEEVWADANDKAKPKGYTTGFRDLDAMLGGLRRGHVALLAAQTSWGKSSFAVTVQDENYDRGVKVLTVSREDQRLMFGRRIACKRAGVNALRLRDRELTPNELVQLGEMVQSAEERYVFLDAIGLTAEQTATAIKELCSEYGFELVIVDYVQRFRAARALSSRRDEVTHVAELLSDAIKVSNAAGLLLSQCKRTDGRPPTMDDVKESGDLENMAEHVMIGWRQVGRDSVGEKVTRNINVPKNKDGPVQYDWTELKFNETTAAFVPDVSNPRRTHVWNDDWDARYP